MSYGELLGPRVPFEDDYSHRCWHMDFCIRQNSKAHWAFRALPRGCHVTSRLDLVWTLAWLDQADWPLDAICRV